MHCKIGMVNSESRYSCLIHDLGEKTEFSLLSMMDSFYHFEEISSIPSMLRVFIMMVMMYYYSFLHITGLVY